ncbi:MAG: hypothetical protein J7L55_00965 [Desulfurococcales archaeon]|nr:hypothetical protein [Desulfurococcales archaeon]
MLWRTDGAPKCPRCGGRLTYYVEAEGYDGVRTVRYVLRCKSCGYRKVLQEVTIRKGSDGIIISVPKRY